MVHGGGGEAVFGEQLLHELQELVRVGSAHRALCRLLQGSARCAPAEEGVFRAGSRVGRFE